MMPRVAVIHPRLIAGGGSEACALGLIKALQDDHRVTLITMGRPDLGALSAMYGAGVDLGRLETRFLAVPPGTRKRFDALRTFPLARYCRRRAGDFEAMVSAYNVMDFGTPGIQMIADLSFDDGLRRELDLTGGSAESIVHRASLGRTLYLGAARALAGERRERWMRNRTVANSKWTQGLLKVRFGVDSEVVYPPVTGCFPSVPWAEREDGFVVVGRLVPQKGIPLVVAILDEVRRTKPVHLHILGRRERSAYADEINALCRRYGDWVHYEGEIYGPDKAAFLARHKYGISGCRGEAFGIAVAEMVRAGAIVWVPDRGGQIEIVDHPDLVYSGSDNAVELILRVIGDAPAEADLRRHLEARAESFTPGRFAAAMRSIVRDFLQGAAAVGA